MAHVAELPVAVELPAELELDVTLYVEREVGWRRVPAEGPPTPALLLTQRPRPWPPSVVVLRGAADPGVVRRALIEGAVDVVSWPEERHRLAACAARLPSGSPGGSPIPAPTRLVVAAAAGGAGASTVALAVAGLAAWAGRSVVVAGGPGLLRLAGLRAWDGPGADELGRLAPDDAAREFARVARPAAGVPSLWLLAATAPPAAQGWPVDLLVVDAGTLWPPEPPSLVVVRPDAALERLHGVGAGAVVNGTGPCSPSEARRMLGREPLAWLPTSARVARAGCAGRVPASLPGSWLCGLRRALAHGIGGGPGGTR